MAWGSLVLFVASLEVFVNPHLYCLVVAVESVMDDMLEVHIWQDSTS